MNIQELKVLLNLLKELNGDTAEAVNIDKEQILGSNLIGKYVILRGYDSGVHFGKLEYASKGLYRLSESRRLWRYWAKKSIGLSGVALHGLADRSEVKICGEIPLIEITDDRISEIIPCSEEAIKSIKEYKEAEQD